MTCISGPPCRPGNTALLIFLPSSGSFDRIMPPRGPRSVLCVVVVTTCACGSGLGNRSAATRPAKCAMSTMKYAPTSSATRRMRGEIDEPRIGRAAGDDQLRLFRPGQAFQFVVVQHAVVARARRTARRGTTCRTGSARRHASGGRRPPRLMPRMVSPGLQQRQEHRLVGLRAGMRLHVGEGAVEQLLGARRSPVPRPRRHRRSRRSSGGPG